MNKKLKFEQIKNEVSKINKHLIIHKGKNTKKVNTKFLQLRKIFRSRKFTKLEENEIMNVFNINLDQFRKDFAQHASNQEVEFAKKLIHSSNPQIKILKNAVYVPKFIHLNKKEIKQAKISKKDKVLFIGSGPVPITAIFYNKYAKCKVDCYEQSKKSADLSKKLIKKLRLSDEIKVYTKQGQSLNRNSYTVIIIALLAEPKNKIFVRLKKMISHNTRIICRTSVGITELFWGATNTQLLNKFKIMNKVRIKGYQVYSIILMK